MRLNERERIAISQAATETLPSGARVSLFGSRTDDTRKGGDIDLLVETQYSIPAVQWVTQRSRFVARIWQRLGVETDGYTAVQLASLCGTHLAAFGRAAHRCDIGSSGGRTSYSATGTQSCNPADGGKLINSEKLKVAVWEADRHTKAICRPDFMPRLPATAPVLLCTLDVGF